MALIAKHHVLTYSSGNMAYNAMGGVLFIQGLQSKLTGLVEGLYGINADAKVIMQLLRLNLPVQFPPVLRVGRRVGHGISDHHQ